MARPLESISTEAGQGIAFLILAVIALISYGSINRFVGGVHWVDQTHRVLLQLEELMAELEHTESRQQG